MKTLLVSVSGIRGIIGNGLEPQTIVKYSKAFADFCDNKNIVVGRDSRITGEMVKNIVIGTLSASGANVFDIGIVPTPTVQFAVKKLNASGGIAISASHNPNEWNALKLLNSTGQFLTPEENKILIKLSEDQEKQNLYVSWDKIGKISIQTEALKWHKEAVLKLKYINLEQIRARKFKVVLDCVNGAGAWIMPELLRDFGCEVIEVNCQKNGIFPRLPEPLPENLIETMEIVKKHNPDLCIVVDPDVDRLVLIDENGEPFIEENTVALATDFVLSKEKGNVVVNLSTTRAVDDIAKKYGCQVFRTPVGEANVVKKMKEINAVIGGEGSGGVICPALHYGRDALVGTALVLQKLAEFGGKLGELKKTMPKYFITKRKIEIGTQNPDKIISTLADIYKNEKVNLEDGLRIDFDDHWVHFRKSNTEPIIRIIVESSNEKKSSELIEKYLNQIILMK